MMAVITISRQFGSNGDLIARKLSKKTGYPLIDKKVVEQIYEQFGYTDFQDVYDRNNFWSRFDTHHTEMLSLLQRIFSACGAHGNLLLLGRGGFVTLAGIPNVIHVRVQAPFQLRVNRVMQTEGLANLTLAEKIVEEEDRARRQFIEMIGNGRWDDTANYDLVIDTQHIPAEMAVEWIEQLVQWNDRAASKIESPSLQNSDPVILRALEDVLKKQPI